MPTIKFIRDTTPYEGGPHKAGDVVECSDASAERWVKRGAAERTKPKPTKEKAIDSAPRDKSVQHPPKDKAVKRGSNPDK